MDVMKTVQRVYDLMMDGSDKKLDKADKLMNSIKKEGLKKLSKTELGKFSLICGQMAYYKDFPDEAIKMLKTALKLIDEEKKADALFYIGSSYVDKEDYNTAKEYLIDGLNVKNITKQRRLKILAKLVICFNDLGVYKESIHLCGKIMNMYMYMYKNNSNLDIYYYMTLSDLVICYWKLRKKSKALEYANKVIKAKKAPNWVVRRVYMYLGHMSWENDRDFKTAIEKYKEALKYAKSKEDKGYIKRLIKDCKEDEVYFNKQKKKGHT
ncbi:MAG: hypothetical protein P9M13_08190 [Candidatus Ancaeobacter aquaticus]|nr:hypothetical protein [Candidatus Ancaeobacter aquaticus]